MCKRKTSNLENKNKKFNFFIFLYNLFFFMIEVAIFSLVIICIGIFFVSVILLLIEAFKGDAQCIFNHFKSVNCLCNNCYKVKCVTTCACSCYKDYLDILITLLSLSLTGVLVPLLSIGVTIFLSSKALNENLSKELAKAKSIKCYLLKLPLGAWGALYTQYQAGINTKERLLSDYKYALHLLFDGEVFQAYDTQIKEVVCLPLLNKENKQINENILLWRTSSNAVSFVSDISGVSDFNRTNETNTNKSNANESNITVLVDKENEIKIESNFLKEIFNPKKLIFTIKFKERVKIGRASCRERV